MGTKAIRELENCFIPIIQNCKNIKELKTIHACVVKNSLCQSNFLVTKMVDVCDVNEEMKHASLLFQQVMEPNEFLFNAMIRGFAHNSMYSHAIECYKEMLSSKHPKKVEALLPDNFTFPFVIKACAGLLCHNLGKQIHSQVCKFGPQSRVIIENALIDMYTKCDNLVDANKVFDEMRERDVISWNCIISGYVRLGQVRKGRALFDTMPNRSIVSWTALISGYTRIGCYAEALSMFRRMQVEGIEPDEISIVSVLPACAHLGALQVGKWIHWYCGRNGLVGKTNICNALIEMYAKCGNIDQACQLFDEMRHRDVISWSTMIGGLAYHGKACEAIDLFVKMKEDKIDPNGVTFLGLLSACSHAGFWSDGLKYFNSMRIDYGIKPEVEHYGILVDLLGRAGQVKKALEIIMKMPMKAESKIWGSLLSSCRTHCNLEIALIAIKHLEELEPDDTGNYVLLSNIYADLGRWDVVSKMRKLIRSKSTKRTPGCSSIDINNVVHEFGSGDTSKPFSEEIFRLLKLLTYHCDIMNHTIEIISGEEQVEFHGEII